MLRHVSQTAYPLVSVRLYGHPDRSVKQFSPAWPPGLAVVWNDVAHSSWINYITRIQTDLLSPRESNATWPWPHVTSKRHRPSSSSSSPAPPCPVHAQYCSWWPRQQSISSAPNCELCLYVGGDDDVLRVVDLFFTLQNQSSPIDAEYRRKFYGLINYSICLTLSNAALLLLLLPGKHPSGAIHWK